MSPSTTSRLPRDLLTAVVVVGLTIGVALAQAGSIEEIEVQGLRRMTREPFLHALGLKKGDPYDVEKIRAQFRKLWQLGLFSDVTIEAEDGPGGGKVLIVKVKERPYLASITYEENKVVSRTDIEERLRERKVKLEVGKPVDQKGIFETETVIRDMLGEKGYLDAKVDHALERVTETSNAVRFMIRPGGKTRIRKIEFVGNTVFGDGRLLKQMKLTRPYRWYWPFSSKSLYHPAKWDQDTSGIRDLYRNHGYLDADLPPPVLEVRTIQKEGKQPKAKEPRTAVGGSATAEKPPPADEDLTPSQKRRREAKERKREEKARKEAEKAAQAAEPRIKRWVYVTATVTEGKAYRTGKISVTGNRVLGETQVLSRIPLREGSVLNAGLLDFGSQSIQRDYRNRGYAYATVTQQIVRRQGEAIADVEIRVVEDQPYTVARIDFTGNTATRDRVLRREFRLNEGELFNQSLLDLSLAKVNQLGYFEVDSKAVTTLPIEGENRVIITVPGEEKEKREIQVGGGYSGMEGFFFQGVFSTRNFLGRGQILSASIQVGGRASRYAISFQEPWLFNRPYTLGFSLFRRDLDYGGNLKSSGKGTGVLVGRQIGPFTTVLLNYNYETLSSTGFTVDGSMAMNRISSLTPSFEYDKINNPYRPTRGWSLAAALQAAGGLFGGDTYFLRPSLRNSFYKPFLGRTYIAFHGELGMIRPWKGGSAANSANVNGVPRLQRYWIGGDLQGPRAFETRSVSPLRYVRIDPRTGVILEATKDPTGLPVRAYDRNGDNVLNALDLVEMGGDRYFLLQGEWAFTTGGPLEVAAFVDVGNSMYEDTPWGFDGVRVSAGVEVRFYLPVFPYPLRLIYGVPVRKVATDRTTGFMFSIGRSF